MTRPAIRVLELRNYLLQPGRTHDFIRYFEEHFLRSQRDEGMHVLGQFELDGEPDRFVWIRGFEDMRARLHGLTSFYGGAFWQARRDATNAMLLDHENVHLLRPLGPIDALTGGEGLEDRAAAPPATTPPEAGLVVVDFYRIVPAELGEAVARFERRGRAALVEQGHAVLAHLVAETAPNDYPRLRVIQDPGLVVVVSAYRDAAHCAGARRDWDTRGPRSDAPLRPLLTGELTTLRLRPTARSLIRYRGAA